MPRSPTAFNLSMKVTNHNDLCQRALGLVALKARYRSDCGASVRGPLISEPSGEAVSVAQIDPNTLGASTIKLYRKGEIGPSCRDAVVGPLYRITHVNCVRDA
jgi:hypothetical protein